MKYRLLFLLPLALSAGVLSTQKEAEFEFDKNKSVKQSLQTKRSWINPVFVSLSHTRKNGGVKVSAFSVNVNQPIFKSGAIYYSIKYANLAKEYNIKQIELKKRELIKQAYDLAYEYKINEIQSKITALRIKNAQIDVERKKEAFESGELDSSFLDNAILNLNNLKLTYVDINSNLKNIEYMFKNISSLDIKTMTLPHFKLITLNTYLNQNIELNSQKTYAKIKHYLYKMQRGNQLLSVSLNANYTNQVVEDKFSDKQVIYSYGISANLPLDINSKTKIEQNKIDYLKSKTLLSDKKNELKNRYLQIQNILKSLKQKKEIYLQNASIYQNLIISTAESVKGGEKTPLDLEVLKNSKEIMLLNAEIMDLNYQKNLLGLYYKLSVFKEGR
ncbi:MAG: TolC family protein [Epsilonproteobacteria bacterium]|nr:TolC family protein [Campylobacterota bacterium]